MLVLSLQESNSGGYVSNMILRQSAGKGKCCRKHLWLVPIHSYTVWVFLCFQRQALLFWSKKKRLLSCSNTGL